MVSGGPSRCCLGEQAVSARHRSIRRVPNSAVRRPKARWWAGRAIGPLRRDQLRSDSARQPDPPSAAAAGGLRSRRSRLTSACRTRSSSWLVAPNRGRASASRAADRPAMLLVSSPSNARRTSSRSAAVAPNRVTASASSMHATGSCSRASKSRSTRRIRASSSCLVVSFAITSSSPRLGMKSCASSPIRALSARARSAAAGARLAISSASWRASQATIGCGPAEQGLQLLHVALPGGRQGGPRSSHNTSQ